MAVSYEPGNRRKRYRARAILRIGPEGTKKIKKEIYVGHYYTREEAERAVKMYLSSRYGRT